MCGCGTVASRAAGAGYAIFTSAVDHKQMPYARVRHAHKQGSMLMGLAAQVLRRKIIRYRAA